MKKTLSALLTLMLCLSLAAPAQASERHGANQALAQDRFAAPAVQPSRQKLKVNGVEKKTEVYNIDGSNYFKLRDIAMLLDGTGSQFSVDYNDEYNAIEIITGEAYTPVGGELSTGTDRSATTVPSAQSILINRGDEYSYCISGDNAELREICKQVGGVEIQLSIFNIGGSNFFKLRDLGEVLGFGVDYDSASNTVLVTSYEGDPPVEDIYLIAGTWVTAYFVDADGNYTDFEEKFTPMVFAFEDNGTCCYFMDGERVDGTFEFDGTYLDADFDGWTFCFSYDAENDQLFTAADDSDGTVILVRSYG